MIPTENEPAGFRLRAFFFALYCKVLINSSNRGGQSQILCKPPLRVRIEQSLFAAAVGLSGCRLVNSITPEGLDVKSGEAVHHALNY